MIFSFNEIDISGVTVSLEVDHYFWICFFFSPILDTNNLATSAPVQGVFMANAAGSYKLTYYDSQRLCELLGATLATYDQLYAAWEAGLQRCSYVWVNYQKEQLVAR